MRGLCREARRWVLQSDNKGYQLVGILSRGPKISLAGARVAVVPCDAPTGLAARMRFSYFNSPATEELWLPKLPHRLRPECARQRGQCRHQAQLYRGQPESRLAKPNTWGGEQRANRKQPKDQRNLVQ